ncbi:hypothetical protein [Silvanigrella sp.]|jgi:hypothetical protein|uniref:hypothetical protein n=1 Tax=Silvanigrella sp. TaxID=2024976 RepID=UPI0037C7D15E
MTIVDNFNADFVRKFAEKSIQKEKEDFYKDCDEVIEYTKKLILNSSKKYCNIRINKCGATNNLFYNENYIELFTKHFIDLGFNAVYNIENYSNSSIDISW